METSRRGRLPIRVVKRRDHLVFARVPGVHDDKGAKAIETQHREARLGERAQVAAGALHPEQLHRIPGDRVGLTALRGGVPAGVVRVARIGTQSVRTGDQVVDDAHAPHPA